MSAWTLGSTPPTAQLATANAGNTALKTFIDKVVIWIPGDVVGFYIAAVAALGPEDPQLWLLALALALAPTMVVLGARATAPAERPTNVPARATLALVATAIWTLTVPGAGWQEWAFFADNLKEVAIAAAAAGLVFGPLASLIVPSDGS